MAPATLWTNGEPAACHRRLPVARDYEVTERRIGAFGGTFDPIHNGHIQVAREVVRRFGLDRLFMIPAYRPPHKSMLLISDAFHRHAMAVLATINEPALGVSTIELDAPDKPYTFETIERLRAVHGEDVELFFVMGADSFQEIDTWREPVRVLESANWIVVTRPGHETGTGHLPEQVKSRIIDLRGRGESALIRSGAPGRQNFTYLTDCVSEDISSTQIRQMIREGRRVERLVPKMVAEYIEKCELYRR